MGKTTREKIEIMEAFERGEEVQYTPGGDDHRWYDDSRPSWNWYARDYRIKPKEPRVFWVWIRPGMDGHTYTYTDKHEAIAGGLPGRELIRVVEQPE